jgi:hypothetical protein
VTQVYLTIDTESSMGGAWADPRRRPVPADRHVFCRNGRGAYGIEWMVESLRRYGMRATFFCETLAGSVLGEEDTRSFVEYLFRAGQDVQLHAHPTYWHYAVFLESGGRNPAEAVQCDRLSLHTEAEQRELLQKAYELFVQCAGVRPTVFRAGGFAGDHVTLRVLRELGFVIDSSYNPIERTTCSFVRQPLGFNLVQKLEGIWELPITVARTRLPERGGYKNCEISAISASETQKILEDAYSGGMEHVVVLFHSFSSVKPRDVSYSRSRPNRIVIRRFETLLHYLDRNSSRFAVATLGDLAQNPTVLEKSQKAVVPDLGLWRPALRKCIQGLNNFYWV